jgi:hypothetical protein
MKTKAEGVRVALVVPPDIREFLEAKARKNWSCMNTEAVKALREAKEREQQASETFLR